MDCETDVKIQGEGLRLASCLLEMLHRFNIQRAEQNSCLELGLTLLLLSDSGRS